MQVLPFAAHLGAFSYRSQSTRACERISTLAQEVVAWLSEY
jgi:hypothetical protein